MMASAERLMRATARLVVALATASLVALLALALAVAPTAPAEAAAIDGQSWIPGEIPPDLGDPEPRGAVHPSGDDRDDGDDAVAVRAGLEARLSARHSGGARARRRGNRPVIGADPRGPPAV
jgi:hypothetical protein